jgi:death-on-curing protein
MSMPIARNHPLVDGNVRLAWAATRTLCLQNGRDLTYESVDVAEQFVLDVAAGALEQPDIATWLASRIVDQST